MVNGKVFSHNKLPQWEEPFECCLLASVGVFLHI